MSAMNILPRPGADEYGEFYAGYVGNVPDGDVLDVLTRQGDEVRSLLSSLTDDQAAFRYQPGKWSIKEVAGHLADGERVFSYRALCVARDEKTPLPGYEQDDYVARARFDDIPLALLVEDLAVVRRATLSLFKMLSAEEAARIGTASGAPVSARAIAYMIAGHEKHHLDVLRDKYLSSTSG